jgi:hypothetical protein
MSAVTFSDGVDLIAAMTLRGYPYRGINNNPRQRIELQGQPRFADLYGLMWDGDGLRYEDQESYKQLSL